jgi:hypothetical protein
MVHMYLLAPISSFVMFLIASIFGSDLTSMLIDHLISFIWLDRDKGINHRKQGSDCGKEYYQKLLLLNAGTVFDARKFTFH